MYTHVKTPREQLGEEIAKLRPGSRADFLRELDGVLPPDHRLANEGALFRLETGKMVKISRELIDAICLVTKASKEVRTKLYFLADKNALFDANSHMIQIIDVYSQVIARLSENVESAIAQLSGNVDLKNISPSDIKEIICSALEVAIDDIREEDAKSKTV